MWQVRIYDHGLSENALDLKVFKTMRDVANFLIAEGIILMDASICIDFVEV